MLLSSINVGAKEDHKDDGDFNDRRERNETTVTSVETSGKVSKNGTTTVVSVSERDFYLLEKYVSGTRATLIRTKILTPQQCKCE